jgi:hypothetical protein
MVLSIAKMRIRTTLKLTRIPSGIRYIMPAQSLSLEMSHAIPSTAGFTACPVSHGRARALDHIPAPCPMRRTIPFDPFVDLVLARSPLAQGSGHSSSTARQKALPNNQVSRCSRS